MHSQNCLKWAFNGSADPHVYRDYRSVSNSFSNNFNAYQKLSVMQKKIFIHAN